MVVNVHVKELFLVSDNFSSLSMAKYVYVPLKKKGFLLMVGDTFPQNSSFTLFYDLKN